MTAEQIVRALAACDDIIAEGIGCLYCPLCMVRDPDEPTDHKADCPWRLAVEWVAARHDDEIADDPDGHVTGDLYRHADGGFAILQGRERGGERRYVLERGDGQATLSLLPETFAEFVAEGDGRAVTDPFTPLGAWIAERENADLGDGGFVDGYLEALYDVSRQLDEIRDDPSIKAEIMAEKAARWRAEQGRGQ